MTVLVLRHVSLHEWVLETAISRHYITTFNVVKAYDAVEMCKSFLTSFNIHYALEIADEYKHSHYAPQDSSDEVDNGKQ